MFRHILAFVVGISIPFGILGSYIAYKAYQPPSLECVARMYEPYSTGVILTNHSPTRAKITDCKFEVYKIIQTEIKGKHVPGSEEIVFMVQEDKVYWTGADIIISGNSKQNIWIRIKDRKYPGCSAMGNLKLQYGKYTLNIHGIVVDIESW